MPAILLNLIRSPKVLGGLAAVLLIAGLAGHHWWVMQQRDRLEAENATLSADLATARANARRLEDALYLEREAAAVATAERDEARRVLDTFRAGRENDPEAQEWAARPVPPGERARLCAALPEMEGCSTPDSQ